MEPVLPWHGYYYYGPDPAAGCSYGVFEDESCGEKFISVAEEVVYSPMTGKPATMVMKIPEEQEGTGTDKAEGEVKSYECTACGVSMRTNTKAKLDKVHCFKCGTETKGAIKEKETMDKEKLEKIKARVRARIQARKEADAATSQTKTLAERIKDRIRASKAKAAATPATAAEDYVQLDDIIDEVEKGGDAGKKGEEKAKAGEECPPGDKPAEEKPAEPAKAGEEGKEAKKEEGKEGEDAYVDLDMVLSNLEKRAERRRRMRRILARKRAMARLASRREALAAQETKVEEVAVKPVVAEQGPAAMPGKMEEVKAPAPVAPAAPAKAEEAKEEEKKEEKKDEAKAGEEKEEKKEEKKDEAKADKGEKKEEVKEEDAGYSTSMKYEPLASLTSLASVAKSDIDMALYGEQGQDPTWAVSVKGVPACRVRLAAQAEPDTIRKIFVSEDYAIDLIEHCATAGFVQTMARVNAEFWANHTSDAALADRIKSEMSAEAKTTVNSYTSEFEGKFMKCLNIAIAGANKNFYPEVGNPLKDHFFANMNAIGVPEETAYMVIEKTFAEGGAEFFNAVIAKALEFYKMPEEARSTIAKAVAQSEALDIFNGKSLESAAPATLSHRLAQASVVASINPVGVREAPMSIDTNEYKAQLRDVFKR